MAAPAKQLDLFAGMGVDAGARIDPPSRAPLKPVRHELVDTVRPPQLPAGAQWHEVQTDEQRIGFILRRSRRKSIGLVVNDDGLQITAPAWVSLKQVDATINEKSRWILEKLRQRQIRQQQLAIANDQWKHDGHIPYFGTRIYLSLGRHGLAFDGQPFAPQTGDRLNLSLPVDADHHRIRDSVHGWLQKQAEQWFEQRLGHFLDVSGHVLKRWRLSSASTRWGSCSSDASIRLNWRLIHFEHAIIDYVIAHEVAHLRHMNHSKEFWDEVTRILPGFEEARNALKHHDPATLPLL